MDPSALIYFAAPPLPYYLESGLARHAPGDHHPSRKGLGVFDLIVMERGTLHIGEEDREWSLSAGQSLLLLPDRYHYSVKATEEPTDFYWVHFHAIGQWQAAEQEQHASIDHARHYERFLASPYTLQLRQMWTLPYPEQAYELFRKLNEAGGQRQSSSFWNRQQLFEELLRMMDLRQNEGYASPVVTLAENTEAYLKTHYRKPVTSTMLAKALSFHYNYITRCMKRVYGMTPMDYLTKYRLEQAKLLLLKTEWPIAVIAREVGFDNAPYFTNCFTEHNQLSPSKFRKQYSVG